MKPCILSLLTALAVATSTGCCRVEEFWRHGCGYHGAFGPYYGHEGPDAGRYCNGYCANCAEVGRRDYSGLDAAVDAHMEESAEPERIDGIRIEELEPMTKKADPMVDAAVMPASAISSPRSLVEFPGAMVPLPPVVAN